MLPYLWLIPVVPALGFVVVGILGAFGRLSDKAAHRIAVGASTLAFVLSALMVLSFAQGVGEYANAPSWTGIKAVEETADHAARFSVTPAAWVPFGPTQLRGWDAAKTRAANLQVGWTFSIDALTCVMLLVVTGIGTLIHVYSIGYMKGEKGYCRFFAYMNLFMAMMLTLVLAGNFLVMFVGWEGVGLCSYLLIGFYYDRVYDKETGMTCADCGRKAFLANRVGDFGFMIGMLLLVVTFGTLDFGDLAAAINSGSSFWYGSALLAGVGLLLFLGATGKSAQIPLYVWLPDAMAGPTPVSALIHAATMVTAGVYMLARMSALYWHAPAAMLVVAIVGCATAVFAGSMGMAQYDIKKVLAYSTVSQLGYMFLGIGVGAYGAAVFHLATHAFFKACLFLGAGAVITQCGHTNDMRHYGGLWTRMPTTAKTFLIATLALAGLPPLSGFMSKDEILAKALLSNHGSAILWALGTAGAVLTSFYMFRAVYMTFFGGNRTPAPIEVKEAPKVMTNVLAVLAAGAVVVGFVGMPGGFTKVLGVESDLNWFAAKLKPVVMARGVVAARAGHGEGAEAAESAAAAAGTPAPAAEASAAAAIPAPANVVREGASHPSYLGELGLFVLAIVVCGAGFLVARANFSGDASKAAAWGERLAFPRRVLHRKWFVDEFYQAALLGPFMAACRGFHAVDRWVVDGAVNGTGRATLLVSHIKAAFDRWVVDSAVNGVGWLVGLGGKALRRLQSGFVQSYAAAMVLGAFALLAAYVLLAR